MRRLFAAAGVAALLLGAGPLAPAANAEDWIATWTAPPQPLWSQDFPIAVNVPRFLWNQTIRQVASISVGGQRVRAIVRDEAKGLPWIKRGCEAAIATADDAHALAASFEGADGVFVMIPPMPRARSSRRLVLPA